MLTTTIIDIQYEFRVGVPVGTNSDLKFVVFGFFFYTINMFSDWTHDKNMFLTVFFEKFSL